MKRFTTLSFVLALSASGMALAQSGNMKEMDMHKDMKAKNEADKDATHEATATVKSVDPSKGTVTLAHEPIKSLKWPAMTMGFAVKDKAMFDKLKVGEKVNVHFMKQGSEYVITSVK